MDLALPHTAFALDSFLSLDSCAEVLARAEKMGFQAMASYYPNDYRNNDRLVLDDTVFARQIFEYLRSHLKDEKDEQGTVWTPVGLNSRFRFCRYRAGQSFNVHRDGAYQIAEGLRSRLTCQIYLNDGFV